MPIYAYRCATCGHAKDVLQKMSDPVLNVCPACGAETFVKQVTAAGFQLKGSGWYVTDFRGDKSAPKAPADDAQTEAKPGAAADQGTDQAGEKGGGDPSADKAGDKKTADPAAKPAKNEAPASPAPPPPKPSPSPAPSSGQ